MSPTLTLIRRVPFLRPLGEATLATIAAGLGERRFRRGARLFAEGDPCPGFWIVKDGSVNVFKMSEDGRIQILETFGPGEVFALVSALDGGPYPASAEAREESTLVFFPRETLLAAMRSTPDTAIAVARLCAARLRGMTCRVASVALAGVRARVAGFLGEEAKRRGARRDDGSVEVALDAPQAEIARRLGTVREVYARTLRALSEEALIEHRRNVVRILDPAGLQRAAHA